MTEKIVRNSNNFGKISTRLKKGGRAVVGSQRTGDGSQRAEVRKLPIQTDI